MYKYEWQSWVTKTFHVFSLTQNFRFVGKIALVYLSTIFYNTFCTLTIFYSANEKHDEYAKNNDFCTLIPFSFRLYIMHTNYPSRTQLKQRPTRKYLPSGRATITSISLFPWALFSFLSLYTSTRGRLLMWAE